jgi:sugar lactone lactonase YvrE
MVDRTGASELVRVAASPRALLNGVAVSPKGRVFSSFPRWIDGPTPSVCEATPEGDFKTYPDNDWNRWEPGLPPGERFVMVHSLFADRENNLWVVDDAAPHHGPYIPGGPKLVQFDLATDTVRRVYPFDASVAPAGAILGHMRVDKRFAYVTESGHGAILVVDRDSGRTLRRLAGHAKTRHDPTIVPVIEGKEFRLASGKTQIINANLLELSTDREWLYFMALFGPWLRRVPTKLLQDPARSDAEIGAAIEDVVKLPPCAGITIDRHDNLYFSSFTENAINFMGPDRKLHRLVADPRIRFPNEGCIGPDGYLYFPTSQVNRLPSFQADGVSRVTDPWEVLKIKLPSA